MDQELKKWIEETREEFSGLAVRWDGKDTVRLSQDRFDKIIDSLFEALDKLEQLNES